MTQRNKPHRLTETLQSEQVMIGLFFTTLTKRKVVKYHPAYPLSSIFISFLILEMVETL